MTNTQHKLEEAVEGFQGDVDNFAYLKQQAKANLKQARIALTAVKKINGVQDEAD